MAIFEEPCSWTDMMIFSNFKWPDSIPKVPWGELTHEQQELIKAKKMFAGYRPGKYQSITGDQGAF